MKTIFSIIFILFATMVSAAPYLVCDPNPGISSYNVTGQSFSTVIQPAQPDGSIKMDVAGANVGDTVLVINACKDDSTWGRLCSTTVPFTLTRPAPPPVPKQLKLVP